MVIERLITREPRVGGPCRGGRPRPCGGRSALRAPLSPLRGGEGTDPPTQPAASAALPYSRGSVDRGLAVAPPGTPSFHDHNLWSSNAAPLGRRGVGGP